MTRILIHKSPLGPLMIPGVLGEPGPGEPFEVADDIAETLLEQDELYAPAPETDLTVEQLRMIAEQRGVDLTGVRKKPDIIAAIAHHTETATVGDVDGEPSVDAPTGSADANEPQEGGDQK